MSDRASLDRSNAFVASSIWPARRYFALSLECIHAIFIYLTLRLLYPPIHWCIATLDLVYTAYDRDAYIFRSKVQQKSIRPSLAGQFLFYIFFHFIQPSVLREFSYQKNIPSLPSEGTLAYFVLYYELPDPSPGRTSRVRCVQSI